MGALHLVDMKAILFSQYGDDSVLRFDHRTRLNPAPGEVQVRLQYAGMNPVDIEQRKGRFKLLMLGKLPFTPGADFCGTIQRVGRRIKGLERGQTVFGMAPLLQQQGSYAQFMTVRASIIAPKPENMTAQEAAALPLAGLTALQALRDNGKLRPGQHVFINGGSGGVGHLAVQIAKAMGAQVTASCSPDAAEWLRELGADEVIDYHTTDVTALDARFDVFFDVAARLSFAAVKGVLTPKGTYLTTVPSLKTGLEFATSLLQVQSAKPVVVKPSGKDLRQLIDWWTDGQLRVRVDNTFDLKDAAQGQRYLKTGHPRGKVVLEIPHLT